MMNRAEIMPTDYVPVLQKDTFSKFISLSENLGCKIKMEMSKKGDNFKWTMKVKNRNLFSLKADGKALEVKASVWNLDNYREQVEQSSDSIKSVIISARDCKSCSERCSGGARFNLSGSEHYKCRFSGFSYVNPNVDDADTLCELIILENETRKVLNDEK